MNPNFVLQDQHTLVSEEEIQARYGANPNYRIERWSEWDDRRFLVREVATGIVIVSGDYQCLGSERGGCIFHDAPTFGRRLIFCAFNRHDDVELFHGHCSFSPWKKCRVCGRVIFQKPTGKELESNVHTD